MEPPEAPACAFRAQWGDKEPKKRKDRGGYPINILFDGPSDVNPTLLKEQLRVDLVVFREPPSSHPGIITLPGAAGSLILGHGCRKGRVYVSFGIESTTQWGSEIIFSITDDALCQELRLFSRKPSHRKRKPEETSQRSLILGRFLSLEERVNRLEQSHPPAGSPLSPQPLSVLSPQPQGSPPVPDLPLHETYVDQTSPEEDFWALAERLQDDPDLIRSLQANDSIFDSPVCISESDAGSVEEFTPSTPKLQRVEGPTVYVSKVKSDAGLKRIFNLDYFKSPGVRARLVQMLKEIKPAEYKFIESAQAGNNVQIGLIAQDVERFFPEIITSEGYSTTLGRPVKHIDLYGLQTVLFAAAQLQLEQHEALSKRMDSSNEDMGKLREELYQELRKVDTTAVTAAARVQRMGRISSILKRRKKLMNEKKTTSAQQQLLHPSILSDLLNRVLSLEAELKANQTRMASLEDYLGAALAELQILKTEKAGREYAQTFLRPTKCASVPQAATTVSRTKDALLRSDDEERRKAEAKRKFEEERRREEKRQEEERRKRAEDEKKRQDEERKQQQKHEEGLKEQARLRQIEETNRQEALMRQQHKEEAQKTAKEETRKQEEARRQQQQQQQQADEAKQLHELEMRKLPKEEKSVESKQEEQHSRRRADSHRQPKETEEKRIAAGVIAGFAATDAEVAGERAAALRRSLPLPRQEELGEPQSDREKAIVQYYDSSRSRSSTRDDFAVQILQELEPLFKKQPAYTERLARRLLTYLAPQSSLWIRCLSAVGTSLFYKAEYKMSLEYFQYAADRCELGSVTGNLYADSHLNVAMILCTEFGHYCDSEMHARLALRHSPAHERALWYLILSRIHREDYVAALDIANAAMVVAPSPMLERARMAVLACMGPDDSTKMKTILADFERDSHGISLIADGRSEFAKTAATLQQALALKRT